MSLLTTLDESVKTLAVWFVRFYVLILGVAGVGALIQGAWLFAALGLSMPVLYFAQFVYRNYRRALAQPQKQTATEPTQ